MHQPKPQRPERNAGSFLGPDMTVPAPMRTRSDDYRDTPTEPVDPIACRSPSQPSRVRRLLERPVRPSSGR